MAITLNDNILIDAPKPSDPRFGPWLSIAEAETSVPVTQRYVGLPVGILDAAGKTVQYHFESSTANGGLVPLTTGSTTPPAQTGTSLTANSVTNEYLATDVKVGSLASLLTSVKTSVVGAVNELLGLYRDLRSDVGTLSGLTTTAKGSLVAAINEVNAKPSGGGGALSDNSVTNNYLAPDVKVGSLSQLVTLEKGSLVGAVNEVFVQAGGVQSLTSGTIKLDKDAEYATIYSGTFTLDTTGAKVGAVVFAYLGPAAYPPTLPSNVQVISGAYVGGRSLMYAFKVGSNSFIQCIIAVLP
jgi:hypothetical protein